MIVYLDENIPDRIAKALKHLEKDPTVSIDTLKNKFGEGCLDEDWIPRVGKQNALVFTRDKRIKNDKIQRQLYHEHGVNMIFISSDNSTKDLKYWDLVQVIIKHWQAVKQEFLANNRPITLLCTPKRFELLN